LQIPQEALESVTERERQELTRREQAYRGNRAPPEINGRIVVLIDDGIATGSTMRAAIAALRAQHPTRIVIAVPTAAPSTCEEFRFEADEIIAVMTPEPFYGVGQWYEDFSQVTDDEVRELLARAVERRSTDSAG
jgi:predicted phosphoribosyltransferase